MLPGNLDAKLAGKANLTQIEVRRCLLELREKGWVRSAEWDNRGIPLAKLEILLPPEPHKPHEQRWLDALHSASLSEQETKSLFPVAKGLAEMPATEMSKLIGGLIRLRAEQDSLPSKRKYEISARFLLASSKFLKNLPSRNLIEFGIRVDVMEGPPRYVIVAGSESPIATILVENPHSFEAGIEADVDNKFCWISTYGYGLSKQGESFGEQLTEIITLRQEEIITLARRRKVIDFWSAIQETPERLFFWGDLDLAGLDIYGRLKSAMPKLELCPLYQPMVDILRQGGCHSYTGTQKEGQTLGSYPFPEIAPLAEMCRTHGVDQEAINITPEMLNLLMA